MKILAVTAILVSIFLATLVIILDVYEVNHVNLDGHLSSYSSCRCNHTKSIHATSPTDKTAHVRLGTSINVIPHLEFHKKLMMRRLGARGGKKTNISLVSAFEYPQQINVVISSSAKYGDSIYCRYFVTSKEEIGKPFKSVVFPEYSITCIRRNGARFMSLSDTVNGQFEYPVPITNRTQSEPTHFFSICLAPIYGTEPKWLQLAELIEHYKIQGATHFYIYLKYIDEYSRALLDDYVRTGEAEVITLYDRFKRKDRSWQAVEIQECLNRARGHSRWVAFVDLDERLTPTKYSGTLKNYLKNVATNQICVHWDLCHRTWPCSQQKMPLTSFNRPSSCCAECFKIFLLVHISLERATVLIMSVHSVIAFFEHYSLYRLEPEEGVVRHYRDVNSGKWGKKWLRGVERMGKFSMTNYPEKWANELLIKVQERVHYVYGGRS